TLRRADLSFSPISRARRGGGVRTRTCSGMCAVFASPRLAVDAAVAAQRVLDLPVRMGIATGEAELRDGDYFGTVLNRTARVMAAGMAVRACSTAQRRLCSPALTSSTWARDNSATLPNLYAMNQVQAPGLRLEFPPLNTLDATPGNLRYPTTSFIGRDS